MSAEGRVSTFKLIGWLPSRPSLIVNSHYERNASRYRGLFGAQANTRGRGSRPVGSGLP